MIKPILPVLFFASFFGSPVYAQGSLGVHSLNTELTYGLMEDDSQTLSGLAQLDVRITQVHGLQLDFGLKDSGFVTLGQLGAHLYMQPVPDQKYGLFVTLADVDDFSVQYMNAGIEGQFALTETTVIDARFGIGGTTGMGGSVGEHWDYVFAGVGIQHQFGDSLTLDAGIDVTEFDERTFQAVGIDSHLRLTHTRPDSSVQFFAEVRNSALFGQDAAPSRTSIGTGIQFTFGGDADVIANRPFQMVTPLDQLIDREVVALQ